MHTGQYCESGGRLLRQEDSGRMLEGSDWGAAMRECRVVLVDWLVSPDSHGARSKIPVLRLVDPMGDKLIASANIGDIPDVVTSQDGKYVAVISDHLARPSIRDGSVYLSVFEAPNLRVCA